MIDHDEEFDIDDYYNPACSCTACRARARIRSRLASIACIVIVLVMVCVGLAMIRPEACLATGDAIPAICAD